MKVVGKYKNYEHYVLDAELPEDEGKVLAYKKGRVLNLDNKELSPLVTIANLVRFAPGGTIEEFETDDKTLKKWLKDAKERNE